MQKGRIARKAFFEKYPDPSSYLQGNLLIETCQEDSLVHERRRKIVKAPVDACYRGEWTNTSSSGLHLMDPGWIGALGQVSEYNQECLIGNILGIGPRNRGEEQARKADDESPKIILY